MKNATMIGTVSQVESAKALVRVMVGERESNWMPVLMQASVFKRHFIPLRMGEQVAVFGGVDAGFAIRGIFHSDLQEPNGSSATKEVTEYEDGTTVTYDTASKIMEISGPSKIIFNADLLVNGTITDSVGLLTDHTHTGVQSGGSTTGGRP